MKNDSSNGQFEPGDELDAYRVVSVLGTGASGTVYEGVRIDDPNQSVALKVIHPKLVRDHQVSRRFRREARILKTLVGPNLVQMLDSGFCSDGRPYLALELVRGTALDQALSSGPMSLDLAVALTQGILAALHIAHQQGVVHRDLKPGNVLVDPDGTARVLDFGMAKVLRGDGSSDSLNALTEQNMVFGTPEYMAPEQARGDELDHRADIYATGIILYELLTGKVPFEGKTVIGVMTAQLKDDPPPPSGRESSITPAVEAVILHALAKDRDERYASAQAMSDALSTALAQPDNPDATAPEHPDELATRDTDYALELPDALMKTQRAAAPVILHESSEEPVSRTWLIVGVLAAVLGIAMGVLMSFGSSAR